MLTHEHGITEMTLQIEDDECIAHSHHQQDVLSGEVQRHSHQHKHE